MKSLRALKTKKGRDETGRFIVEGEKAVSEIPAEWEVAFYVCSEKFAKDMRGEVSAYAKRAPCETIRDALFESVSDTKTPQGIIAVCAKRRFKPEELLRPDGFVLICENLSDPGNAGTLIRSAAAAGASGIVFCEGSVEYYSPKVIRAAAGSALRIPFLENAGVADSIAFFKRNGYGIYAADAKGEKYPYDLNLTERFCAVVGNESRGISREAASAADKTVRLPMAAGVESLNVSVAGSVLLYEAVRQRLSRFV